MDKLFESERLYYRVWIEDDVEAGYNLWGSEAVMKYIEPVLSKDRVLKSIKNGILHYEKYNTQLYAMVMKETDEIIGCCGFSVEDYDAGIYEFGIHIMENFHSKGYGYEAGRAAIHYLKTNGDAKKIIGACHEENEPSEKLMKKLGFHSQGLVWFDDTSRYEKFFEYDL